VASEVMWGQRQTLLAEPAGWASGYKMGITGREGSPKLRIMLVEAGKWIQQGAVEHLVGMGVVGPAGGRGATAEQRQTRQCQSDYGMDPAEEMLARNFCIGQGS